MAALIAPGFSEAEPCLYKDVSSLFTPIVNIITDTHGRVSYKKYGECYHLKPERLAKRYSPTGIFQCGNAHGAANITMSNDVLTTAGHVLFDESGFPRAKTCTFTVWIDGKPLVTPIDMTQLSNKNLRIPSKNIYALSTEDDWAVIHLPKPIAQGLIEPYEIAANDGTEVDEGGTVRLAARGHFDWGEAKELSLEDCVIYREPDADYTLDRSRNYDMDCTGADGASGSSVFAVKGRNAGKMIGTYEGARSKHLFSPNAYPYSRSHYNFFTSLEGGFRDAVEEFSGKKATSGPAKDPWPPAVPEDITCKEDVKTAGQNI